MDGLIYEVKEKVADVLVKEGYEVEEANGLR